MCAQNQWMVYLINGSILCVLFPMQIYAGGINHFNYHPDDELQDTD